MRSAIIKDGIVANVIVGSIPGSIECPKDVGIGWSYDGNTFTAPPQPEPEPPTIEDCQAAIETHVESVARSRDYSSSVSLASYYNSTIEPWAGEAQAFVPWRDAVWIYAFAELEKVQTGQREQPTVEDFIAELPVISWPT